MQLSKELITEHELLLIEGIKFSDMDLIDRLLHKDLLFIAPNGAVVTKSMDLDAHRAQLMQVEYLNPSFENYTEIGDTAISVVTYDTKGSMMGNEILGVFRYIRFWKIVDDSPQVIGGSCVQIA